MKVVVAYYCSEDMTSDVQWSCNISILLLDEEPRSVIFAVRGFGETKRRALDDAVNFMKVASTMVALNLPREDDEVT